MRSERWRREEKLLPSLPGYSPPSFHSVIRLLWPLNFLSSESVTNALQEVFFALYDWNVEHKQTRAGSYRTSSAQHGQNEILWFTAEMRMSVFYMLRIDWEASSGFNWAHILDLGRFLDGSAWKWFDEGLRVGLSPSVRSSVRQIFLLSWIRFSWTI